MTRPSGPAGRDREAPQAPAAGEPTDSPAGVDGTTGELPPPTQTAGDPEVTGDADLPDDAAEASDPAEASARSLPDPDTQQDPLRGGFTKPV